MIKRILVTGGAGFIGSHFIRYMLKRSPFYHMTNVDAFTYAANHNNLSDVCKDSRYSFIQGDVCDVGLVQAILADGYDAVVHFAAESHVDRSIEDPSRFWRTNVMGTQTVLDAAFKAGVKRFIHVSTDEVYGSLETSEPFTEQSPLAPNSPYAASKAASDFIARSYNRTYGYPIIITRCSNNYGAYQHPEKFIPTMIRRALRDEGLPLYGDGRQVRDWLHVEDHCAALAKVLYKGALGEVYNIGGNNERMNLEVAESILALLDKPKSLITFTQDRKGHDRRYAIDAAKLSKQLNWTPSIPFEQGLKETVEWYVKHQDWWE